MYKFKFIMYNIFKVKILVRWGTWLKKGGLLRLIICILVTIPGGIVFGWIDFVWVLLFKKFFLQ